MQSMLVSHYKFLGSAVPLLLVLFMCGSNFSLNDAQAQSGTIRPLSTSPATQTPTTRPPSRRPPSVQTTSGQSTVKGRVFYKDNAQPLKGVQVRVFPGNSNSSGGSDDRPPGRAEMMTFTNNRGEFQLSNLAAGKFYVTVEGAGMMTPSGFGMKLPVPLSAIPRQEDFEEIVPRHDAEFTVDGTNTIQVEVVIVRGGTISGKVLRTDRAPVAEVTVSFVLRGGSGSGLTMSQFSTQTDKDGDYRMANLPPGEYVVAAATEDKRAGVTMLARLRGESRILTYHPAATTVRDAMSVRVDPGRETGGINITLVARNTFSVSGTIMRQQDGTPLAGAIVLLRNKDSETGGVLAPGLGQRETRSDSEGNWSFSNVLEGSYDVMALVPATRASPARVVPGPPPSLEPNLREPRDREQGYRSSRQRFLVAQQEVTVAGADLQGVSLGMIGPGSIRGMVSAEDGGALPTGLVIFLDLMREGNRPGPPLPVRVEPDGSFNVDGIQGGDLYLAVALPPGSSHFIKSLTVSGDDPRRTPLKVIEGAETGPLQVIISAGLGSLTGRVLLDKTGEGLSNYVLLLAPVEREKQRFRTAYLAGRTASDGTFSLSGEPGEYFIIPRKREELPPIVTEEFVRTEGARAQRVVLVSGEQKRLDLRIP